MDFVKERSSYGVGLLHMGLPLLVLQPTNSHQVPLTCKQKEEEKIQYTLYLYLLSKVVVISYRV